MWKQLLKRLKSAKRAFDAARTTFYVYRVHTPEGDRDIVSLFAGASEFGLTGEAIVGGYTRVLEEGERATEANFQPNPMFVKLLHEVVAHHAPQLRDLREEARRQHDGWVYVIDGRTPTPDRHVPPKDIIGSFEVQGGAVAPASYQPNAKHELLTADGLFRLEPALHEKLIERINSSCSAPLDRLTPN
jgi:hypothetical protein